MTGPPEDVLTLYTLQKPGTPWSRAFDVRLNCFTTIFSSCVDFGQLAPSSWADHEARRKQFMQEEGRGAGH
jgi:hypothetical protein